MRKPNFFIIGAPKCGTTSLYYWLAEHPQVYMSPVKEPQFFCDDFEYARPSSLEDYLKLFEDANINHIGVGEASATYLFSKNAVHNIEKSMHIPKYIVLIRNPVEMALSLHDQLYFDADETVKNFETAWDLQEERAAGRHIPLTCRVPAFLQYHDACCLGKQVKRLLRQVPLERVKLILLDDVKRDARAIWLEILDFLGLDDDGRRYFPVRNKAKAVKSHMLILLNKAYASFIRKQVLRPLGTGFLNFLNKLNVQERSRPPLSPQFRKKLINSFHDDVRLLERILGRSLGHWMETSSLENCRIGENNEREQNLGHLSNR